MGAATATWVRTGNGERHLRCVQTKQKNRELILKPSTRLNDLLSSRCFSSFVCCHHCVCAIYSASITAITNQSIAAANTANSHAIISAINVNLRSNTIKGFDQRGAGRREAATGSRTCAKRLNFFGHIVGCLSKGTWKNVSHWHSAWWMILSSAHTNPANLPSRSRRVWLTVDTWLRDWQRAEGQGVAQTATVIAIMRYYTSEYSRWDNTFVGNQKEIHNTARKIFGIHMNTFSIRSIPAAGMSRECAGFFFCIYLTLSVFE